MLAVLDTNVLVSALWSREGTPARIIALVQSGIITPCFDSRIMEEYYGVLRRDKFGFEEWEITQLLAAIEQEGILVVPPPISVRFIDEADRKFFETAKYCDAPLITGNSKHYPKDPLILSPAAFLAGL